MPEFDSKGRPLITVVRILEYHGPAEWVGAVFEASRFPATGEFKQSLDGIKFPEGCFIRSGLVQWTAEEGQPGVSSPGPAVPIIPPSSSNIQ